MHENYRKMTKDRACMIMLRFVDHSICLVSLMILAQLLVPERFGLVFTAIMYAVLFRAIALYPLRSIFGRIEGAEQLAFDRITPLLQSRLLAGHQTPEP